MCSGYRYYVAWDSWTPRRCSRNSFSRPSDSHPQLCITKRSYHSSAIYWNDKRLQSFHPACFWHTFPTKQMARDKIFNGPQNAKLHLTKLRKLSAAILLQSPQTYAITSWQLMHQISLMVYKSSKNRAILLCVLYYSHETLWFREKMQSLRTLLKFSGKMTFHTVQGS